MRPSHICLYISMDHLHLLPVLSLFWYSIYCYKNYLDFRVMTCLFSKWVVNNYGQGGGHFETASVGNILENTNVFKVHGWKQWKCFGLFHLKYTHQYYGMEMQQGVWEIFLHIRERPWNCLLIRGGSWNCTTMEHFNSPFNPTVFVNSSLAKYNI